MKENDAEIELESSDAPTIPESFQKLKSKLQ